MSGEERELITWLNTEIIRAWPFILAALAAGGAWLKRWRRLRKVAHMGLLATLISDAMAAQLERPAAVMEEVREQVANDHTSNLREDVDELKSLQTQESQIRSASDQRAEQAIADLRAEFRDAQAQTHSVLRVLLRLAEGSGPPAPAPRPREPDEDD